MGSFSYSHRRTDSGVFFGESRAQLTTNWRQRSPSTESDKTATSLVGTPPPPSSRHSRPPKNVCAGYFVLVPHRQNVGVDSVIHQYRSFQQHKVDEEAGFGHPALVLSTSGGIATCLQVTSFGGQPRDDKFHDGRGARDLASRYVEIQRAGVAARWDKYDIPIVHLQGLAGMVKNPSYINAGGQFEIEVKYLDQYSNGTHELAEYELARLKGYQAKLIDQGLAKICDKVPAATRPRQRQQQRQQTFARREPGRGERLRAMSGSWR